MRQLKIGNSITLRQPVLHTYLYEISKIEMISPEEEVSLAQKIKQGNTQALEKLITANLRFVVSVAKMYQHKGLSLCDLINEGNIGLIKAAHKFDLTFGFKFISYAVWWIRQAILQAIAEKSRLIRIPSNQVNTITGINKAINEFELQHQRRPTQQELAERSGCYGCGVSRCARHRCEPNPKVDERTHLHRVARCPTERRRPAFLQSAQCAHRRRIAIHRCRD